MSFVNLNNLSLPGVDDGRPCTFSFMDGLKFISYEDLACAYLVFLAPPLLFIYCFTALDHDCL